MSENYSPHDIFISYSRNNKDMVLPIKEEMERTLGLRRWIDISDIPCSTENFIQKVIPGIKQARVAFLFFFQPNRRRPTCKATFGRNAILGNVAKKDMERHGIVQRRAAGMKRLRNRSRGIGGFGINRS